ncbi:hypothetical protein DPMN_113394 [Dreissena polymorpha]|uniref:Uncharacterized protein n=1 Tax=Dreissena polymorpha TaxID=45954 RepID=A0A9D4QQT1_DREPO|nr:hypothetical protein DPMN_113394 [Dreissena polymorpha]
MDSIILFLDVSTYIAPRGAGLSDARACCTQSCRCGIGTLKYMQAHDLSLIQGKLGLMHVLKGSSQTRVCSLHRLMRDDTVYLHWTSFEQNFHESRKFCH